MAAQPGRDQKPFHITWPVLESLPLSKAVGTKVFMKLENVQPVGSFKIRGIGHLCQEAAKKGSALLLPQPFPTHSIHAGMGKTEAHGADKLGLTLQTGLEPGPCLC
ncbi:hypothetical protein BTVI_00564 [Pitangus sulphuratus]|nr:hypothetical protein BTVI_00564 [Pitangus sulphuratus]